MKSLTFPLFFAGLILLAIACQPAAEKESSAEQTDADAGFVPLFDGQTTAGWHNYNADTISPVWQVQDGALYLSGKGGGDIVTDGEYDSFILTLDWKISEGGNSGVFFHVVESDTLDKVYFSGPEIQVLDDERHADAKLPSHQAGSNYDLHPLSEPAVKPAGEWNSFKIVVDHGHVEHWLNGKKVVDYQLGSPEWEALYQASKFTQWPLYGRAGKGHIALQDHGDPVWFKNIKIKTL